MKKREFEPALVIVDLVKWIQNWFHKNGSGCNAIIGISGGKDSTIAAAILAKALGPDRVIGVAMPDEGQGTNGAEEICKYLGIHYVYAPISAATKAHNDMSIVFDGETMNGMWSKQAELNVPARERMITLYHIGQTFNGRVCCTCNLSEDYVGYCTRWGDGVGDFAPFANITVMELLQIGEALGLPLEWVYRTPDDGLPNSCPDEEKFGFTYDTLDKYLLGMMIPEDNIKEKIDHMHEVNEFKTRMMDSFPL